MANPWFRLWTDMVNDPKFRTIARVSEQEISRVISVYVHMMTCASNATERGHTEGWCDEDVATALDINTEDVQVIREAMQGRVLDGDYLTGWEKRQPLREREDDTAADRKRQQRAREANKSNVTPSHAKSHQEKPREEEIREEEKREEKSKAKAPAQPSAALPDWIPAGPWAGYIEMRKKKRKEPTARAIELLVTELEKLKTAGHDIGAVLDKSTVNGWTDVYAPKQDQQPRGSPGTPSKLGKAGQATAANANRLLEKWRRENGQAE